MGINQHGPILIRDNAPPFKVQRYLPAVFLINTKHHDGTPALCTRIRDDDHIDLAGGEEFLVGYIPEIMTKPEAPQSNG